MARKNQPGGKFDPPPQRIDLPPIPVVPKSLMRTAREISSKPPEYIFGTPDGNVTVRLDQMTEDDVARAVALFEQAGPEERGRLVRYLIEALKHMSQHRQWAVDELIKLGEIMEHFYRQTNFMQPD